jgi:HK97 family phage portal protein
VTTGQYPLLPHGVSEDSVLALSAVIRSLQIITDSVCQLPWVEFGPDGQPVRDPSPVVVRPYAAMTRREWTAEVCISLALSNISYIWKVEGQLVPVPARWCIPTTTFDVASLAPPESYRIGSITVPADEMIVMRRLPFPGVPPQLSSVVRLGRAEWSAMLAADTYVGRYWAAGGSPTTVLSTEQPMTLTQATEIRTGWQNSRSQGPDYPVVLSSGLSADSFGADPTKDTAVLARRDMIADVARYFGIPIRKLESAVAGASNTYINAEIDGLELVRGTLAGYMQIIGDAITGELAPGNHMAMNPDPLTRPVLLTRYQAYAVAIAAGFMTPDEVRAEEGMPPLPEGYEPPGSAGTAPVITEDESP